MRKVPAGWLPVQEYLHEDETDSDNVGLECQADFLLRGSKNLCFADLPKIIPFFEQPGCFYLLQYNKALQKEFLSDIFQPAG